jgi:hypothetical protein
VQVVDDDSAGVAVLPITCAVQSTDTGCQLGGAPRIVEDSAGSSWGTAVFGSGVYACS